MEEELTGLAAHGLLAPRVRAVAQSIATPERWWLPARERPGGLGPADRLHMMEQFFGLQWGHLMFSRLLGVVKAPKPEAIGQRARMAKEAFLTLYSKPISDKRKRGDGGKNSP